MCRFKSGIILKDKVVLAPKENNSHSELLDTLAIEDCYMGAAKKFVRVELVPPNYDVLADIQDWKYIVDQDIVPDWYEEDKEKYEQLFRSEVQNWIKENIVVICGKPFEIIKKEDGKTYFLLCGRLYYSSFGDSNSYEISHVRMDLLSSGLAKDLKAEFGDRLVSVNEYGDVLGLMSIDLYYECESKISILDFWWWLSTSCGSDYVRYVFDVGDVLYLEYYCVRGVRPFFILKS